MRSASIIRRSNNIIIHPWSKAITGLGIGTPPIIVLDFNEEPQRIGEAILEALDAVQIGLPHPDPDDEVQDKSLYDAAGVKNWSQFVKGAASSQIIEHPTELEFSPWKNLGSRGGFQDVGIESVMIPRDSDPVAIGKAALKSLELAEAAGFTSGKGNGKLVEYTSPKESRGQEWRGHAEASIDRSPAVRRRLLASLEKMEFFRHTNPEHLQEERNRILQQGWSGIFGENGRWFFADAEDLAEGGVSAFLTEIAPFLEAVGITLPPLEEEFDFTQGYTLLAGEERLPIWTEAEYERDADLPGLLWGLSSARTVKILNRWLKKAGSEERAYGVNGGNDFAIFFLTPELQRRICRDPEASPADCPYAPILKYPLFGQRQD